MKTYTFDEICESQKFNHDEEFVLKSEASQLEEVFRHQCEELREVVSTFDDVQHLGRRLSWSLVTEYKKLKLDSETRSQQMKSFVDAVEALITDASAPEPFNGVGYFINTELFLEVQGRLAKLRGIQ